jgi:hypothetical protein
MNEALKGFTYLIAEDVSSVTLNMPESKLSPKDLDELIFQLSRVRATLKPIHPKKFPPPSEGIHHPLDGWDMIPKNTGTGGPVAEGFLLVVRSPAFGWFHYEIHPEEAAALLSFLQGAPTARPPGVHLN